MTTVRVGTELARELRNRRRRFPCHQGIDAGRFTMRNETRGTSFDVEIDLTVPYTRDHGLAA